MRCYRSLVFTKNQSIHSRIWIGLYIAEDDHVEGEIDGIPVKDQLGYTFMTRYSHRRLYNYHYYWYIIEKKRFKIEVNNNINKTNNYISAQIIEHKKQWRVPMENRAIDWDRQTMWRC